VTDQATNLVQDNGNSAVFSWHPDYQGCSVEKVRRDMIDEIRRDQRAYELALQAAEQNESASLQSIMKLDNRWSSYDFGWVEADPEQLTNFVMSVELERERRQEMVSVKSLRSALNPSPVASRVASDEGEIAEGLHIPRWAYLTVTILVVIGLLATLVSVF
jgi:hypothetical protein